MANIFLLQSNSLVKPADTDLWYTFESVLAASRAGLSPAYPRKFSLVLRPPTGHRVQQPHKQYFCEYAIIRCNRILFISWTYLF